MVCIFLFHFKLNKRQKKKSFFPVPLNSSFLSRNNLNTNPLGESLNKQKYFILSTLGTYKAFSFYFRHCTYLSVLFFVYIYFFINKYILCSLLILPSEIIAPHQPSTLHENNFFSSLSSVLSSFLCCIFWMFLGIGFLGQQFVYGWLCANFHSIRSSQSLPYQKMRLYSSLTLTSTSIFPSYCFHFENNTF